MAAGPRGCCEFSITGNLKYQNWMFFYKINGAAGQAGSCGCTARRPARSPLPSALAAPRNTKTRATNFLQKAWFWCFLSPEIHRASVCRSAGAVLTSPSCSHLLPGLCTPNLSVQPAAAAQTCSCAPDVQRPRARPHGQQVPSSQSFRPACSEAQDGC